MAGPSDGRQEDRTDGSLLRRSVRRFAGGLRRGAALRLRQPYRGMAVQRQPVCRPGRGRPRHRRIDDPVCRLQFFISDRGPAIQFPRKADIEVIIGFKNVATEDVFGRTGMTFHACRFDQWDGVAINALSGMLSVTDSDFLADKPTANLGPELVAATFAGNRFAGEPRICSECAHVAVDHKPVEWDKADLRPHVYALDPRPRTEAISNAREPVYGAVGDGKMDDSPAIQKALDAAAKNGGTVFLPAGVYRCAGSLSVPQGVELRGVGGPRGDSAGPEGGPGTMLLAAYGRGEAEAAPLIRLQAHAGLRGVRIAHPGLFDLDKIEPHPWTVRLEGESAYVLDCLSEQQLSGHRCPWEPIPCSQRADQRARSGRAG